MVKKMGGAAYRKAEGAKKKHIEKTPEIRSYSEEAIGRMCGKISISHGRYPRNSPSASNATGTSEATRIF